MIEFKHNPETGKLEVWKDGIKTGEIDTMGDEITKENEIESKSNNRQK